VIYSTLFVFTQPLKGNKKRKEKIPWKLYGNLIITID